MARCMLEATADREQDIERWVKEMADASAAGNRNLVAEIHYRILDARRIIEDSGY